MHAQAKIFMWVIKVKLKQQNNIGNKQNVLEDVNGRTSFQTTQKKKRLRVEAYSPPGIARYQRVNTCGPYTWLSE